MQIGLNPGAKAFVPAASRQSAPSTPSNVAVVYENSVKQPDEIVSSLRREDCSGVSSALSGSIQDTSDYDELVQLMNEELFFYETPTPSPRNRINEQLENAADYSQLMRIVTDPLNVLTVKEIKKTVEVLFHLYKKSSRSSPPIDLVKKIGALVLKNMKLFAPYELRKFVDAFRHIDSSISDSISKYLIPKEDNIAHPSSKFSRFWKIHPIDDTSMEKLLRSNGSHCPKCYTSFSENLDFSLIRASLNRVESYSDVKELAPYHATVHPINFPEVIRLSNELIHCIQGSDSAAIEGVIAELIQNGGRISSQMMEMSRRCSCSYKIMKALIVASQTVTLEDFRAAFVNRYPLEMISFMISQLSGLPRNTLEEVMEIALECQCPMEVLQLIRECGCEMTLPIIKKALHGNSFEVSEFVISSYKNGMLSGAWDLPYLSMETLPREKWDYVFNKLEEPFEEYSMHTILNHFLSLNILRKISPQELEAARYFLDKGGYIPERSVKPIVMSGLPPELKLELLERWIREGGVVTSDLIAFAMTPKTNRIECKNTKEVMDFLFSHWAFDQAQIPELMKVAARWPGFLDFLKTLMDLSDPCEFLEEFLNHKQSVEIVERFLARKGYVPSVVVPRILSSDLPASLKLKIVQYWLDQGGEVSFEILKAALFSASYKNLHEIIEYIYPFWRVDSQKIPELLRDAALGGAQVFIVQHLIDLYEEKNFIIELLHHNCALELVQYFCEKRSKISTVEMLAILRRHIPSSKDAKLWLIGEWSNQGGIVTDEILKFAKDCKNPPEVIALLLSLQKGEILEDIDTLKEGERESLIAPIQAAQRSGIQVPKPIRPHYKVTTKK